MSYDSTYTREIPLVEARSGFKEIDSVLTHPLDTKPTKGWWIAFAISFTALLIGALSLANTLYFGIGEWGNNQPVGWAFDIVNFVFWIGIGHAGTLISAILFLFRQRWRTGIARFAEAMTIFAVMTAGIFPIIHTGRPWLAGYLLPLPNQNGVWVNFASPLLWDVFAVSTYFTISFLFWGIGLVPDLAVLRDRTTNKIKKTIYSVASLGWNFSNRNWSNYERAYLILAGISTPLVLSVHSIVSFDFQKSLRVSIGYCSSSGSSGNSAFLRDARSFPLDSCRRRCSRSYSEGKRAVFEYTFLHCKNRHHDSHLDYILFAVHKEFPQAGYHKRSRINGAECKILGGLCNTLHSYY